MKKHFKISIIFSLFIIACSCKKPETSTPISPTNPTNPTTTPTVEVKPLIPDGWKALASFPSDGSVAGTTVSAGDKIYYGLGYTSGFGYNVVSNKWYVYDTTNGNWTEKAPFPGVGRANAVGFFLNGKIYVGMGTNYDRKTKSDTYTDFYEYDPASNIWTKKANFKGLGRDQPAYFSIGNKGYLGTGNSNPVNASVLKDLWEYDATSDKWTLKAQLIGEARCRAIGFAIDGLGYIGGGEGLSTTKQSDFYAYDPATDTWKTIKNLPTILARAKGVGVGSNGYVLGGFDNEDNINPISKVYKYDPKADVWSVSSEIASDKDTEKGRFYPILGATTTKLFFGAGGYGAGADPYNKVDFYEYTIK
jgi:N-acetylneuraminic acid mutarotase